jgi:hypothetical protein
MSHTNKSGAAPLRRSRRSRSHWLAIADNARNLPPAHHGGTPPKAVTPTRPPVISG